MTARWTPVRPGNWLFHCHCAFHISNEQSLSADTAAPGGHDGEHMAHRMAGLVLGLRVAPAKGASTAAAPAPAARRELRLLVQAARSPADSAHLMGYALQEGDAEPARDSAPVPGSTLVLERGLPVRITVVNRLTEPTAVHWHGIELESFPDGVPGWSGTPDHMLAPIAPGDSFIAEFTPPRAGTFIYHSHAHELFQIPGGLYGAIIVVPPGEAYDTAANRLVIVGGLVRGDSLVGVVNGRTDPAPIELRAGRTYRFRLINIGDARTYFALRHAGADSSLVTWRALAKAGADLPAAQAVPRTSPLLTGPGETADFELRPTEPGELSLVLDSPFAPWRLAVPVTVKP